MEVYFNQVIFDIGYVILYCVGIRLVGVMTSVGPVLHHLPGIEHWYEYGIKYHIAPNMWMARDSWHSLSWMKWMSGSNRVEPPYGAEGRFIRM